MSAPYHNYREVETPLGRRIKCVTVEEFRRVTQWVAWLRRRIAERNRREAAQP